MHSSTSDSPTRSCTVVACDTHGQPRTYRVASNPTNAAAYRRLATAILRLDAETLAVELRSARRATGHTGSRVQMRLEPAA